MIKTITVAELKKMTDSEGLVLQGCGGVPQEWLNGINEMLTESKILLDGDNFKEASVFKHEGLTNMLFPFDDTKLNVGALAMWRLQTHSQFGGTWLSDYLANKFGIDDSQPEHGNKPDCPLIGQDGNIFNLVNIASRTLKNNGMRVEAFEMSERVFESGSYDEALNIIGEYVNITSVDESADEYDENFDGMEEMDL